MKKMFLALMAMAAITMVGCKSKNDPVPPQPKFFDLDGVVQHDLTYAKREASDRQLVGAELVEVTFMVNKSIDTAKVEDMHVDTVITKFELGEQMVLTCKHAYKNGVQCWENYTVADHEPITGRSFKPEDVLVTWYEAIRVIQEHCPALKGCSASIYPSPYPEIENLLVYNFSVLDVVDAKTGEYIDCTPAPPM